MYPQCPQQFYFDLIAETCIDNSTTIPTPTPNPTPTPTPNPIDTYTYANATSDTTGPNTNATTGMIIAISVFFSSSSPFLAIASAESIWLCSAISLPQVDQMHHQLLLIQPPPKYIW